MVLLPRFAFQANQPPLTALTSVFWSFWEELNLPDFGLEDLVRPSGRRIVFGASGETRTHGVVCCLTRAVQSPLCDTSISLVLFLDSNQSNQLNGRGLPCYITD
jgi:hypothetical protein